MPIKESSDEFNPPAATGPAISVAPGNKTAGDYLALAIATCGVGYIPLAPGTWGSAVGIVLYLLLRCGTLKLVHSFVGVNSVLLYDPGIIFVALELVVITAVTLIGIWAASVAERIFQKKDPGKVVIDEVAGQLIALLPVPLWAIGPWPWLILIAFLLFRAFDIIKPYPVRRLEGLQSGLGIVLDDVAAGAYAAVLVALASVLIHGPF